VGILGSAAIGGRKSCRGEEVRRAGTCRPSSKSSERS
jgi:hypothetical protein